MQSVESYNKQKKRPSWFPILAAFLIPFVCLVIGIMLFKPPASETETETSGQPAVLSVAVLVRNEAGKGVEGKTVTITPEGEDENLSSPLELTTDAGGFVTASVNKVGALSVKVDGKDAPVKIRDLPSIKGDTTELIVVLNDSESSP